MPPPAAESKEATRHAAKAARLAHGKMAKTTVAAKAAAQPIATNAWPAAVPVIAAASPAAKPAAAAAARMVARSVHPRRDALHRPQPVAHEKRRVA
jgi:hypothetical protein